MSTPYHIVEPHPSTNSHSVHTSRGGAGNVTSLKNTSITAGHSATGPASLAPLNTSPRKYYSSGRGGAGNFYSSGEHAIFSFDEELERQLKQERRVAPVIHVGRGGAGNVMVPETANTSRRGYGLSRNWSSSTAGSAGSATSSECNSQDEKLKIKTMAGTTTTTTSPKSTDASRWSKFMGIGMGFRS